jgi:hypothetical protein
MPSHSALAYLGVKSGSLSALDKETGILGLLEVSRQVPTGEEFIATLLWRLISPLLATTGELEGTPIHAFLKPKKYGQKST